MRLSTFAGGCTLESAEAVCGDDRIDVADVGPAARPACRQVTADRRRFGPLPHAADADPVRRGTTRRRAGCRRRSRPPRRLFRRSRRRSPRMSTLCSAAPIRRPGGSALSATNWTTSAWRCRTHSPVTQDAATAQRIAGKLGWFWWFSGRTGEGSHWLEAALACAGPSAPSWRAAALGWWAWLAVQSGQTEHVEERARGSRRAQRLGRRSRHSRPRHLRAGCAGDDPREYEIGRPSSTPMLAAPTNDSAGCGATRWRGRRDHAPLPCATTPQPNDPRHCSPSMLSDAWVTTAHLFSSSTISVGQWPATATWMTPRGSPRRHWPSVVPSGCAAGRRP